MNALDRTKGIMSRVFALGAVVAIVVALTGCPTQAPAPCQIQSSANGPYTIRFTNTGSTTGACPADWGDQWFFDNFTSGLIAMRSLAVNLPILPDGGTLPGHENSDVYGKGTFNTSDPNADGNCVVPALQKPFNGPEGSTYDVKNLTFLSTALYIGTQWKADITYTPDGGTACTYTAQAINPSTTCATNADCNPTSQPVNSGINNLYDQGCHLEKWATDLTGDPATGICFFNAPFPSLGGFKP